MTDLLKPVIFRKNVVVAHNLGIRTHPGEILRITLVLTVYAYGLTASAFLTSRTREHAAISLVELSNEHEGVERRDAVCNHRTYELGAGGLFALHEERLP